MLEDGDIKYYNDIVLYKTIEQIDRIGQTTGPMKISAIDLLIHLADFYYETCEVEKMEFTLSLCEYIKMGYVISFEETYIIHQEADNIKTIIENEYGGPLPNKT